MLLPLARPWSWGILEKMPNFVQGARGAVIIDDRYAPLVVSTFIGIVELPEGRWFEREVGNLIHQGFARGHRIVNIHDTTHVKKTPPEMRKFWAEMSKRNEASWDGKILDVPLVIASPLMRGVFTAVGWLNPKVAQLKVHSTVEKAISHSVQTLLAAGMKVEPPSQSYELPGECAHLLALGDSVRSA